MRGIPELRKEIPIDRRHKRHSAIGPDHQLPAHVPALRRHHKLVWVVMWVLLPLVVVLVFVLLWRHHEAARKARRQRHVLRRV